MGHLQASEFASAVGGGDVSLENALHWHLTANCYPPIPTSMIPVCVAAIDAVNGYDYDAAIPLPEGVLYKGQETAPAAEIVRAHHLDAFLATDEEED